jgi:ribosome-associated protein
MTDMSDPMTDADATNDLDTSKELALSAARAASSLKATDVLVLDVGELLSIAGYFVIASASNPRQVRAMVDEVEAKVKVEQHRSPVRTEGVREQQWTLIDYGDVVVHVFLDSVREFYEIERLYMDAPRIEWESPVVEPD